MACVGRTKECTIVPSNHYGPIPGVPVGTTWKFRVQVSTVNNHPLSRNFIVDYFISFNNILKKKKSFLCFSLWLLSLQVSEAGVHRPHVGGIHGRSNDGSYSLVLAGGFEDEVVGYSYRVRRCCLVK